MIRAAKGDSAGNGEVLDCLAPLPVVVEVEAPHELNHSSYALTGLFDLHALRRIRGVRVAPRLDHHRGELRVEADGSITPSSFHAYKTTFLTLRSGHRDIRMAIDFRDASTIFPKDGLDADVLFKRSHEPGPVATVAPAARARILPAGLSLRIASPVAHSGMRRGVGFWSAIIAYNLRADRHLVTRLAREVRAGRRHQRAARFQLRSDHLRTPPSSAPGSTVFFQTRTFGATHDVDTAAVHRFRVELVRGLRQEFGDRFVGGIIPDAFSTVAYPDCLSSVPADLPSYMESLAGAGIVITSRGLAGSIPWKVPEAMALARCIVAERPHTTLPSPLTDGETLRTFATVEECVGRCRDLLDDTDQRQALAQAGRRYYEDWVDPPVAIHRLLTQALDAAPG